MTRGSKQKSFYTLCALMLVLILSSATIVQASDGKISIRDQAGRLMGTMEADGDIRDAKGAKLGKISLSGRIQGKSGQRLGVFDAKGTIRDASGRKMGSIDEKGSMRDASGRLRGKLSNSGTFRDAAGRSRLSFKPYLPDARLRVGAYIWFFTSEMNGK